MSRLSPVFLSGTLLVLAACGGGSDDSSATTTTTSEAPAAAVTSSVPDTSPDEPETPTSVALVVEGATVVVANGNIVGGSAGRMSDALALEGFETGTPINGTEKVEASVVYYSADDDAAKVVAESLGVKLGGVAVEPLPDPAPVDEEFAGGVLLLLGNLQADKTIAELSGVAAAESADPVDNAGSNVVVANGSGVSGSAGRMSAQLEAAGFTVGTPTNSTAQASESVLYYDEESDNAATVKADADALAQALGGLTVLALPADVPTDSGSLDGDILLVLGTNEADKTLAELAG